MKLIENLSSQARVSFAIILAASFGIVRDVSANNLDGNVLNVQNQEPLERSAKLVEFLKKQYPDARIEWKSIPKVNVSEVLDSFYEMRPGVIRATITSTGNPARAEEWSFSAYKSTWIAKRRIRPGEAFARDDFQFGSVDLTEPLTHEVRGLLLSGDTEIEKFEARVTVLEGQFPITSGVQKIPAVKRGEAIKLILRSGDLELSVPGIVQEPSQIGGTLKVLTSTTKREVTGVLKEDKTVEVTL